LSTKKIRRKEERAQRVQKVDCPDGGFMAFASVSGFAKALGDILETDMLATEDTAVTEGDAGDAGASVRKAKERNLVAVAQLTMAFTTEGGVTFIYKGMTEVEWPSGLAYLVVLALKRSTCPTT
jgi:hypothetical protein